MDELLAICPRYEWEMMEQAAVLAFSCKAYYAEICRREAEYGSYDRDPGATKYDSDESYENYLWLADHDEL